MLLQEPAEVGKSREEKSCDKGERRQPSAGTVLLLLRSIGRLVGRSAARLFGRIRGHDWICVACGCARATCLQAWRDCQCMFARLHVYWYAPDVGRPQPHQFGAVRTSAGTTKGWCLTGAYSDVGVGATLLRKHTRACMHAHNVTGVQFHNKSLACACLLGHATSSLPHPLFVLLCDVLHNECRRLR